ncbi:unnamed protein product [Cyprideis torosa]|uniref:Uncharacterized protein n=1 Tax=Cyprideis torosa TaxID=163714 RepID=A0A7R8WFL1_9CRUS|nr:unnamed protein product [Cyprideis torosa]CAG0891591.1 unnamed protein product [Cyprideis torosa]
MSLIDTITRTMLVKPHPAGYPFIGGALALTILFLLLWEPLGVLMLILTLFVVYFFRDPVRSVPQKEGLVIAPADGRIISITPDQSLPDELGDDLDEEENFTKIKLDKASEENERSLALIKTDQDKYVGVSQIAGLIARRIITTLKEEENVTVGNRFGLIRFGSRTDIYLPKGVNAQAQVTTSRPSTLGTQQHPAKEKESNETMTKTTLKTITPKTKTKKQAIEEHGSHLGLHKLVPNVITLMALAAGLTSIQFAIDGLWERAVIAIVIAAVLDVLDGATARLLNAQSKFGAELDSLSDFLAFGVAPATIMYLWVLEESGKIGWIAMLVFAVASAMRLARYNITPTPKTGVWSKGFFAGVPAPAGAGMAFLPIFIWLMAPNYFESFAVANILVGLWLMFCAGMMVSRIPTWSTKQLKIKSNMAMPLLAFIAVMIAALIQAPWPTLTIMSITYIATIPFSIRHFQKIVKESKEKIDLGDLALGVSDGISDHDE